MSNKLTMGEDSETPKITRQEVVDALRKGKASGEPSPYANGTPEAEAAQDLLDQWYKQLDDEAKAVGTPVALIEANIEKNTILIEAGYNDTEMLDSVIEWLYNDLWQAQDLGPDGEDLYIRIADKIMELEGPDGQELDEDSQDEYDRIKASRK